MQCDCASMHMVMATKLLEGLNNVSYLYMATHCISCREFIQGWYEKGMGQEEGFKVAKHGKITTLYWEDIIRLLKDEEFDSSNLRGKGIRDVGRAAVILGQLPKAEFSIMPAERFIRSHVDDILEQFKLDPWSPKPPGSEKKWWQFWK